MKISFILLLLLSFSSFFLIAQKTTGSDSNYLLALNQQIDNYVVEKNLTALDTLYAEDFVFSHGTGLIEGKASWLAQVARGNYPFRKHDSEMAEMHGDVSIIRGKLYIQRIDKDKKVNYTLQYVRVFAKRNKRWQIISHITTYEQDEL